MTDADQREALEKLRAPFRPEQIGKLPRVTCPDCSDRRKKCEKPGHQKSRCDECQAYVSAKHIHIDYVGHADVTERLLIADPYWSWEPFAFDEDGLPKLDTDDLGHPVGMWIKLTILDVTRPGYGSCPSNQSDAVKVLIGDAIRNAAMRFGVALDLWSKTERSNPAADNPIADAGNRAMPTRQRIADARVVVDDAWVEVFTKRLAECDLDNVNGFRQEVIDGVRQQRINSETANRLLEAVKARASELDKQSRIGPDGLPRNQDGTISRSQVTDEQLAEVGAMTKGQKSAHNKLVKDVTSNPKTADRVKGPDPADPWTAKGGAA
ncbi:hypothetical protein [Streptosporangium sandarakinum]